MFGVYPFTLTYRRDILKEYHKIDTIFKRDLERKDKPIIVGTWSDPVFEFLKDNIWVWTEKVDGTNIRIIWDGSKVEFKGKTDNAQLPAELFAKLNQIFTPEKVSTVLDDPTKPFTMYGEGYGRKIQKGHGYIPDGVGFILFDTFVEGWWLLRDALERIAERVQIPIVPIIGEGTLLDAIALCKNGFKSVLRDEPPEGIVLKPKVELFARNGKRIITKLKLVDFRNAIYIN